MNNVLVTGSEGFIGQNLCGYLEQRGINVERFDTKIHSSGLPVLAGFDAVVHLGATTATTETDLEKVLENNFQFSCNLFNLCKLNDIKFQYASSASVYGKSKTFNEEEFCSPLNPYGFSKYMFDSWLLLQDYPAQGFRYFNVYGQGEDHKGNQASPVHKFTKQAQEGKIKLFEGSEKYLRDFVCVEDVCEAHYRMLASNSAGVFNIGTGKAVSFEYVATTIAAKYDSLIELIKIPKELKKHYQKYTRADNTKLTQAIGEIKWTKIEDYICPSSPTR